MRHKRLAGKILLFTLCIVTILGNITIAQAKQDLFSQDSHSNRLAEVSYTEAEQPQEDAGNTPPDDKDTKNNNAVPAGDPDKRKTVTINGEEIPLNEGENITKNDYTGLLCVGIFAGVLLIAGVRESIVRKRLK